MINNTIYTCSIVKLEEKYRLGTNLVFVENNIDIPFPVKRCYYLYNIPSGEKRGGHAHKNLMQLVIAASGSFDVFLDDGLVKRKFTLNCPYQGLLIVSGIWRDLANFSSGAVCLVLASEVYDESDYIRDYVEFLEYRNVYSNSIQR